MDVKRIREDFPILGSGITYFDNSASSLTPKQVVEEMDDYYYSYRANIHRGLHSLSRRASDKYDEAREKIASFFNCKSGEMIMTKNSTESLNVVAKGLDFKGGKIVLNPGDHHSNIVPWQMLEKKGLVLIEYLKLQKDGTIDLGHAKELIDPKTKLVGTGHISNVTGAIHPIEKLGRLAKDNGALFAVDGAQSAGHFDVNLKKIGCDFFAFSGHKMLGPTGTGGLFCKEPLMEQLEPLCPGGGTVTEVGAHSQEWAKGPEKHEGGTPNIAGVIGLGRAVEYLQSTGLSNIEKHQKSLTDSTLKGLGEMEFVDVYGPRERAPVISFNVQGMNAHDVAGILDESAKICIRSGAHCCIPLMRHFGVEGTARASFHVYNTQEEVSKFLSTVSEIARTLR